MSTSVTTSTGTTVQWDGSSIEAPTEEIVIIETAPPEPEPEFSDPFPEYSSSHPDDGVDSPPVGRGRRSTPTTTPPPPIEVEPPTVEEVATKPPDTTVDPKDLKDFMKKQGYDQKFIDKVTHNPKLNDYGQTGKDANGKLKTELGNDAFKSPGRS